MSYVKPERPESQKSPVRVGTRGWVFYLTKTPIDVEVVELRVGEVSGQLYAKCVAIGDPSGDWRWFPVEDVHTDEKEQQEQQEKKETAS